MAETAATQPLMVDMSCGEGLVFYKVRLERSVSDDDDEPAALDLEARVSPHPVARLSEDHDCSAVAASGGTTILGLIDGSRDTVVLDVGTGAVAPGPRLRHPKLNPVMLPVGDDTVIVMDTFLRGGYCCFEALRRSGPGGGWRADPLPNPPVGHLDDDRGEYEYNKVGTGAFFTVGARVWVSVTDGRGTFSLDTERGEWRKEGNWMVPLHGPALFVPELNSVVGFSSDTLRNCRYRDKWCHHLCAVDVDAGAGAAPVVRHLWEFPAERMEDVRTGGEALGLARLGDGRLCVSRSVLVKRCQGTGTSLVVVELTRFPGGEVQLARRGRTHTHVWPDFHCGQADFV